MTDRSPLAIISLPIAVACEPDAARFAPIAIASGPEAQAILFKTSFPIAIEADSLPAY